MTQKEACERWIDSFNSIPHDLIVKAYGDCPEDMQELTPISSGDCVYIHNGKHEDNYGEIIKVYPASQTARVLVDGENRIISLNNISVEHDSWLPMWSTLWTFGDSCDEWWLESEENRKIMANCGFRIYESEELGFFFGIDGCGYSFFEEHWLPLYKERGLQWHDREQEDIYDGN